MTSPSVATSPTVTMSLAQMISIARKGDGYVGALKSAAAQRLVADTWRRASEGARATATVSSSSSSPKAVTVGETQRVAPLHAATNASPAQLVDDLSVSAWAWAKLYTNDSIMLDSAQTAGDHDNRSSSGARFSKHTSTPLPLPVPPAALKDGLRLMRTPKQLTQTVWALGSLGVFGKNDQVVGQVGAKPRPATRDSERKRLKVNLFAENGNECAAAHASLSDSVSLNRSAYQKNLSNSEIAELISVVIRQALRVQGVAATGRETTPSEEHSLHTWSTRDFAQLFSGLAGSKKSVQNPVWTMAGTDLEIILSYLRDNVDDVFGEATPASRSPNGLDILCVLHFMAEWRVRMPKVTDTLSQHLVQHARAELAELQTRVQSKDSESSIPDSSVTDTNTRNYVSRNHPNSRRSRKDTRSHAKRDNLCLDAVRHLSLLESAEVGGCALSGLIDVVLAKEWTKTKMGAGDSKCSNGDRGNNYTQPSSTRELLTLLYAVAMSGYHSGATAARKNIVNTLYRQTCGRFLDGLSRQSHHGVLDPKIIQDLQQVLRLAIAFDDPHTHHRCLALLSGEPADAIAQKLGDFGCRRKRNTKPNLHFTSTGEQRQIAEQLRKRKLVYTNEMFFLPLWKTVDFCVEVDNGRPESETEEVNQHHDSSLLVEYDGPHHYYRRIARSMQTSTITSENPSNEGIRVEHGSCASSDNHSHTNSTHSNHSGRQKTNHGSVHESESLKSSTTHSSRFPSRFPDTLWGGRFSDENLNSTSEFRITTKTEFETSLMRKLGWRVERVPFFQTAEKNAERIAEIVEKSSAR